MFLFGFVFLVKSEEGMTALLGFILMALCLPWQPSSGSVNVNVTETLGLLPGFSLLARLLGATGVGREIESRVPLSGLTLLATRDQNLQPFLSSAEQQTPDILRYHVLLRYLDPARLPLSSGWMLVDTLYLATGRPQGVLGMVNISVDPFKIVHLSLPNPNPNPNPNGVASIVSTLKLFPYRISIVEISSVLIPDGLSMSSSSSSSSSSPSSYPSPPLPVNITYELVRADRFAIFVAFLEATGVDRVFEDNERREGITIFAPTDAAFLDNSISAFQALPAEQKILVLEFHALDSFYPLGTLKDFKNPITPTIATTDPRVGGGGGGQFRVDVTGINGVVTISDGRIHAPVTATILEHQPVAIYAIERLLMPKRLPESPLVGYVPSPQQPSSPSTFSLPKGRTDSLLPAPSPSPSMSLAFSNAPILRSSMHFLASLVVCLHYLLACAR